MIDIHYNKTVFGKYGFSELVLLRSKKNILAFHKLIFDAKINLKFGPLHKRESSVLHKWKSRNRHQK